MFLRLVEETNMTLLETIALLMLIIAVVGLVIDLLNFITKKK